MNITRSGTQPSGKGPADWFTGTVRVDASFCQTLRVADADVLRPTIRMVHQPAAMDRPSLVESLLQGVQYEARMPSGIVTHADAGLARAALDVLAKVVAILPQDLRPVIDDPAVGTPPGHEHDGHVDIARLRQWSREGRKLAIGYLDEAGASSQRVIRSFMLGYVASVRVVMAWCELRQDFRLFRTDRLTTVDFSISATPSDPAPCVAAGRQRYGRGKPSFR